MSWEIALTGDKFVLEELSKVFKDENLSIILKNDRFILISKSFDTLTDHKEVETKLNELLKSINACVKIELDSHELIGYEVISWLDENGTIKKDIISDVVAITISAKSSICSIYPDGTIEEDYPAKPIINWIEFAQTDTKVEKVFDQIDDNFDSWDALLTTY